MIPLAWLYKRLEWSRSAELSSIISWNGDDVTVVFTWFPEATIIPGGRWTNLNPL